MKSLFDVVGENFFKPLNSLYKRIYLDCLQILYDTYRSELSYGADRDVLIAKLTDYFDNCNISDIHFDEDADTEVVKESKEKASRFLRNLKEAGWVEYETTKNQMQRIVMPGHAVTMMQSFGSILKNEEMEYQGEISAIYSMLTNDELFMHPYPQIIKPVYERTLALFASLKKLNTGIRKYIDALTAEKTPKEIVSEFFEYHDEIGSKAYHRIKTSENISRFRTTILARLGEMRSNEEWMSRAVSEYRLIENERDEEAAEECVHEILSDIMTSFSLPTGIIRKRRRFLKI